MDKNNKKILLFAIVFSVIAAVLIFSYLKKVQTANQNIEYVNIFVAARTIEPKTVITSQDLKEIKIEKQLINPVALRSIQEVINKTNKETIYEGEQILKTRLADKDNSSLSYQIPQGMRAITINVNEASAVGYFIRIGDSVDVIATLEKDNQDPTPTVSKTILQNVLVLGVGQSKDTIQKVQEKTQKSGINNATTTETETKTITLAVTAEQAEKLTLSEQIGTLKLTLRKVGETGVLQDSGITKSLLLR